MSEIGDKIQAKCLAFGDRIIKLNDYLLEQAAGNHHTSNIIHYPSIGSITSGLPVFK